MKRFWSQTTEIKALFINLMLTILGFGGTMFLFWFHRYDVPLAILTSGIIVSFTWLCLYLSKRNGQKHIKLDVVLIYIRLALVVGLTLLFMILQMTNNIVIISPIWLIVAYLIMSLGTLVAYFTKGENDV